MQALELFRQNPAISFEDWNKETGLSERTYYAYKRRAFAVQDDTDQPGTVQSSAAAQMQLQLQDAAPASSTATDSAVQIAVRTGVQHRTAKTAIAVQSVAVQSDALGTAVVQSVQQRNALLIAVFSLATVASLKNMWGVVSTFEGDAVSIVAFTGVFSLSGVFFMLAGLKNRWTVGIVGALVVFEAICNGASIFGGLYDYRKPMQLQPNEFLQRVTTLLHFIPGKNVAQCIALFCSAALASVQFFAIKEIKPSPSNKKKNVAATN